MADLDAVAGVSGGAGGGVRDPLADPDARAAGDGDAVPGLRVWYDTGEPVPDGDADDGTSGRVSVTVWWRLGPDDREE